MSCHHFFCTGRGIPNILMVENNQTKSIDHHLVPEADEAGRLYEENGGRLTVFSNFGQDPLEQREDLKSIRMERFKEQWPSFETIFHSLVNGNKANFRDGLLCFIDLTMQLKTQIA